MKRRWTMGLALLLVAIGWAQAAGFSVRGALRYDGGGFGAEGEAGFGQKLSPQLEVGAKLSLRAIPFSDPLILIVPNAFAEYRSSLAEGVQGVGRAELGLGILPQLFPRVYLSGGVDARYKLADLDVFGQARLNFDFIPTNRATPSLSGRFGAILIPFVPYAGGELGYNLVSAASSLNVFVGSLLYLSPQFFVGLEGGFNNGGYLRLVAEFDER
ncbi:MAG TPA: hypothetical protein VFS50_02665 [Meiothermus sp.]|nr:hypothetical protein [Meiothermus sp.]